MRNALTLLSAAVFAAVLPRAASAEDIMQYALDASVPAAQTLAVGELPSGKGLIVIPQSSQPQPAGFARTMHQIFVPEKRPGSGSIQPSGVPVAGYFLNTPQSHACVYDLPTLNPPAASCNPATLNNNTRATGGTKGVAIVIAFHHPTAANDLAQYSTQFGLPAPNLQIIKLGNPAVDNGWGLELAMDMESVHSMAPGAKIIVVEATTNSFVDLFAAVDRASTELKNQFNGGQISNSYGGAEFSSETATGNEAHFKKANIVNFFSTGDAPGTNYPAASPNVVAVGGTSISRNPTTHNFLHEASWHDGSGGPSEFFGRPGYQAAHAAVANIVGNRRGMPDVSANANPETGTFVRFNGGWFAVGGTSLSAPLVAGIANNAGVTRASANAALTVIYNGLGNGGKFNDVKIGYCGPFAGYTSVTGYEFCTGVGSPHGKTGF